MKMLEFIPAGIDFFLFHHYSFSLIILQIIKVKYSIYYNSYMAIF
jgi:hypothetical protein